MIWGVGTGRCGTHTLAELLEIPHEPRPKPMVEGVEWWQGRRNKEEILPIIRDRMRWGGCVDLHNVPILPLILEMDPESTIVWVWRGFEKVAKSMTKPGHDYWGKLKRDWSEFLYPRGGWPERYTREDKMFWYWCTVNMFIYENVILLPRTRWRIHEADRLEHHAFVGSDYNGNLVFSEYMLNHAARMENWMKGHEREQREEDGLPVLW